MNLFDLIPGNDCVSKVINGVTIGVAALLTPIVGLHTVVIIWGICHVYCAFTGRPLWTFKA